jgi:hypothetical protein
MGQNACVPQEVPAVPSLFASRLFLSGALAFLTAGMMPALTGVALPVWSRAYGLSDGDGGLLLAANGAGSFLAVTSGCLACRVWACAKAS